MLRVGKAIVLTCFFTASYGPAQEIGGGFSYGRHRRQWVYDEKQFFMMIVGSRLIIVYKQVGYLS